ncbi:hypothetical protein ACSLOU_00645 [Enterobacter cloacae]|uniref:hypothetical protein n=1 Tax=Enterobacter cloacae TaxID=550 RepID=UPI003EE0E435
MRKNKRAEVIRALHLYGIEGATVRQVSIIIHREMSGTAGYLRGLVKDGVAVVIGRKGCAPIYALNKGVEIEPVVDIFEQCRQNWSGYQVHKVFGAGGAVRL